MERSEISPRAPEQIFDQGEIPPAPIQNPHNPLWRESLIGCITPKIGHMTHAHTEANI